MLQDINIQGFRKYDEIQLRDFGRINFIAGDNNIGKTTILEAIYTWACGMNISSIVAVPLVRGRYFFSQQAYWMMEVLVSMLHDRDKLPWKMSFEGRINNKKIGFEHIITPMEIYSYYDSTFHTLFSKNPNIFIDSDSLEMTNEKQDNFLYNSNRIVIAQWTIMEKESRKMSEYELTIPISLPNNVKAFYSAKMIDVLSHTNVRENIQIYTSLKKENILDELVTEMRKIFSEIEEIDFFPYPDGSTAPISVKKKDGSFLPMYTFGDGVQRWFYILGCMVLYQGSIICIDEVDEGIHFDAQESFCKLLAKYAKKYDVQIFMTTHNLEFIDNFLTVMGEWEKDDAEKVRIFTLRTVSDGEKMRVLNGVDAKQARDNYNLELR